MTSTQLVFFDEVNSKQVCGPPTTSQLNECDFLFPRNEEGKVDVKICVYETNNIPKKSTLKYDQERIFCLRVSKVESKDGTITGNCCPVFDFTENKIVTIDAYRK